MGGYYGPEVQEHTPFFSFLYLGFNFFCKAKAATPYSALHSITIFTSEEIMEGSSTAAY